MKPYLLLFCLLTGYTIFAQNNKASVLYRTASRRSGEAVYLNLFSRSATPASRAGIVRQEADFTANKETVINAVSMQPAVIRLPVPMPQGRTADLLLVKVDDGSVAPRLGTLTGTGIQSDANNDPGLHYRGYVQGDSTSIAAISLFKNGWVMGLFSGKDGDVNIGKTADGPDSYVAYYAKDMRTPPTFQCGTSETPVPGTNQVAPAATQRTADAPPTLCNEIRFYWEGDYRLYSVNFGGNLTNTFNYITGVFNQVATVYQNEGIRAVLTSTYVWTTADPYPNTSSLNALVAFKNRWNALGNTFQGDIAHLVAGGQQTQTGPNNGGIAYLLINDLCNRAYAYAYSNIYGSYSAYPTYSWDVNCLSHEIGHNLGAHHTHWCGWNTGAGGACGAIDNCYTLESGSNCTTCTYTGNSSTPGFKGTIMSYCYLLSGVGTDLSLGFGPLPQATIRSQMNTSTCLLKGNNWTGAVSTAWENAANWSCGSIPDLTTEVYIPGGLTRYPVVSSAAVSYSVRQAPGTSVNVNAGFTLRMAGPPRQ